MKEFFYGIEECYFVQFLRRCLNEYEDVIVVCGLKEILCYFLLENEWYKLVDMMKLQFLLQRNLFIQFFMSVCYGKFYIICIDDDDGDVVIQRYDLLVNFWVFLLFFIYEMFFNFLVVVNFQGFLYVFGGRFVRKYNFEINLWYDVLFLSVLRGGVCVVVD